MLYRLGGGFGGELSSFLVDSFFACRKECWIVLLRIGDFVKGLAGRGPGLGWLHMNTTMYIDGVIDSSNFIYI